MEIIQEASPCFFFFLTMEFFITKMKITISNFIQRPKFLDLSMEKRIIPCFQITQTMFFVHLVNENVSLIILFETVDMVIL